MLRFKKVLALTLGVVLTSSVVFTGCGKKAQETAATADASKLKPYELTWYTIGTPAKDLDLVSEEISKYTKEKINATVKMKQIDWGDYNKKMQVIISSGQPFDICFTCSWANDYIQNATKGAFVELNDLMDKYGKETKAAINPAFIEGAKINGKLYAVPANKELGKQSVWRFNKKYVDKYNIDITKVRDLESLEPYLKLIKEKEPDIAPLSSDKQFKPYLPFDYILDDNLPFAVYLDTKDFKVVNQFETPEMMKALETMHRYYKAGYLRADVATLTNGNDEKTGKWFVGKCDTQPFADSLWSTSLQYPVVSTPMHDPLTLNMSVMGSMQAISTTSGDPERAMMFLNLLNTDPKLRNMVDSGIEGTHYKKIGDNMIEDIQPRAKDYDMPTFSLGNIFITYLQKGDPANKWDEFKKFNEASKNAPTLGFHFNIEPVKTELAAVKNVAEEFNSVLLTGSVDPKEYLPKAIEKFKAAGSDKITAEMQKQYDEWRKKNNK